MRTVFTTCPLCEATCGLELTVDGDRITKVRGDREDDFSKGFICPKGASLGTLDADPDRLATPLIKRDGEFQEATWDEAFAYIDERLKDFPDRNAIAMYLGNPIVHSLAGGLYAGPLRKALGSRNIFTASTVDQMPKHVQVGHMYGSIFSIPVPDIDRTDFMLVLGADPFSSNGSLWTVPDVPGRFKDLQKRGGKFVVVDPRRSRTAQAADQHVVIRPGSDVFLLLALIHELFAQDLVNLKDARRARHRPRADPRARRRVHARKPSPNAPASTRRPSASWPGRSPVPNGPPSTAGSARRPSSSARSRAGRSTCSTSSPATSTGPAA